MNPLELQITAPGAPQTAEDLRDVARANDAVTESTHSASRAFAEANPLVDDFGRRGGEGRRAMMELDAVMRGGSESVFGLAGAFRSLTIAMEENPLTAIVAVLLAVVIPAFEYLKKTFEDAAAAAQEMQKKNAETFKTAAEDTEKLNEVKLDRFRETLREVAEDTKRIVGEVDAVDAAYEKVMHAEAAFQIAKIKADPTLTEEEKTARIGQIEQQTRSDDRTRQVSKLNAADAANADAVAQLRAQRDAAQAALDQVKSAALAIALKPNEVAGQLGTARKRLEDAKWRGYVSGLSDDDAAATDPDVAQALSGVRRLENALAQAEANAADPTVTGHLTGLEGERQKALDDAQKALNEATKRADEERAKNNAARFGITGAGEYEDQTKSIELQEQEHRAKAQDEAEARKAMDALAKADAEAALQNDAVSGGYALKGATGTTPEANDALQTARDTLRELNNDPSRQHAEAAVRVLNEILADLKKKNDVRGVTMQQLAAGLKELQQQLNTLTQSG